MHPAPSIIVFTVLSGLGYGLAAMLGLNVLDPAALSTKIAHVVALGSISAGLLASTLHLGNPQRAWRALSQWRSSWLSREGVLALLTLLPLIVSAWASMFEGRYILLAGLPGSVGAFATVFCTSMIYASLRSIDGWHTPLTSLCYLLFSLSGGLIAAALFAALSGAGSDPLALLALLATLGAWSAKFFWRRRLKTKPSTSTAETATGLGHLGRVRLFEPPHMTANYLTREMGFKVARKHADKLFAIAFVLAGGLPAFLLALQVLMNLPDAAAIALLVVSLAGYLVGTLTERWLFFAEARHSVMSYYGS
jgi:DMSO reductase anchor subunit